MISIVFACDENIQHFMFVVEKIKNKKCNSFLLADENESGSYLQTLSENRRDKSILNQSSDV